jgi:hypothetical protein
LIGIQTTEVVVPLFLLGAGLGLLQIIRRQPGRLDLCLMFAWLLAPVLLVILLHSSLYGNLRQMFFVLPPMFVLSGVGLELILGLLRTRAMRLGAATLALAPGLAGIVALHPYEDSYYNAWVGWTSGAYGRYQVDPWCTSYKQAMEYINVHAPPDAAVLVRGPFVSAADFARPDLKMHPDFQPVPNPDYALLCQVDVLGDGFQGDLPVVYRVTRGRAVLAVVRGTQ